MNKPLKILNNLILLLFLSSCTPEMDTLECRKKYSKNNESGFETIIIMSYCRQLYDEDSKASSEKKKALSCILKNMNSANSEMDLFFINASCKKKYKYRGPS